MSTQLFANDATSTLAGAITSTAVTVNLQAGGGARFPNPAAGQYFVATFNDAATGLLEEIVWVTARSTDTLTIVRAQEGTTALAWNSGDLFSMYVTAGTMSQMLQQGQFPSSVVANGYQQFPSGLIMQWGSLTFPTSGTSVANETVTFPLAFPNACFAVTGASQSTTNTPSGYWPPFSASAITTSGFTATIDNLTAGVVVVNKAVPASWIAMGY